MNLNKLLDQLSKVDLNSKKKISKYLSKVRYVGKTVKDKSIKELEIKKLRLELTKRQYDLGSYISQKHYSDKISDFSYDDEFKSMNEKIVSLIDYIDKIKEKCEEMYQNDDISSAGNGRYFILTEEKKQPKKASAPKSEEVDLEKELNKLKDLLNKGLITEEQYDAKSNELLGL